MAIRPPGTFQLLAITNTFPILSESCRFAKRRHIQLIEKRAWRQRQEPDLPFDSPPLVVPFQNPHLLQDDAKVALALGVERVRVPLGVDGGSQAGFLGAAVELLDIVGKRKPITAVLAGRRNPG